jgi:hypothetical protein
MGREPSDGDRLARSVDHVDHAQPRDQADLVERRRALGLGIVAEPPFELAQDGIAGVAADADDEGKAELLPVGGVEPAESVELFCA